MTKTPGYKISHSILFSPRKDGERGVMTSSKIKARFNFDTLLISPNAEIPPKSSLLLEIKVFKGKQKSPWMSVAEFKYKKNISFPAQKNVLGQIDTDVFIAASFCDAFMYRATSTGKTILRGVTAAYTKHAAKFNLEKASAVKKNRAVKYDVKPLSQTRRGGSLKKRICSPACVTMLLNYKGVKKDLLTVCKNAYDKNADIYGNWLFNTLRAGGYAARLDTLERARNLGKPFAASISYKRGELKNAPQPATPGHLVVVKGFDADGNVIVNDPAAPTDKEVERIYNREEFAKAWLKNKKGLIYLI